MRNRLFGAFGLMRTIALACLCVLAFGGVASAAIELKLGHIQSENDLWHLGALKFKEEIEKNSNGEMTVTLYPNSVLGADRDLAEGLQMGTVDFALIAGVLANFEPVIGLIEPPYMFDSQKEFTKIIYGDIGKEIAQRMLDSAGIRILDWWDRGSRQITSNKPINGIEDLKGLKIRVPEIPAMIKCFEAMGASPTPMAWNEVYTGLEQKVIEAQENPIPFIYGGRIHEVQKYLAFTNHKYEFVTIAMSDQRWQSLTPEQRKIIQDASNVATKYENQLVAENTSKILETMQAEGLQVTYPKVDELRAAARSVHEEFAKSIDIDLYKRIMAELGR